MLRAMDMDDMFDGDGCSASEDEEGDEDPEMLADLERRQEEIVEQFMEIAFAYKHEVVEALKQSFKGKGVEKDDQKEQIKALQKRMDEKRKQGVKVVK